MLLAKSRVRKMFKVANRRVPVGFIEALNNLTVAITEQAIAGQEITKGTIEQLAHKTGCKVLARHISAALDSLKKDGLTDTNMLIKRAKAISRSEHGQVMDEIVKL